MSFQSKIIQQRSKSQGKQQNQSTEGLQTRRKSCYCSECGKLGQFQLHNAHLPTLKDIQFQEQQENRRKPSLCDEIKTEIPSELSLLDSENGRFFRNSNRSISILNKYFKTSLNMDQQSVDQNSKVRRKSCECRECGQLTTFQKKHEDLALPKRGKKTKQFLIRKHRQYTKFGSKDSFGQQKSKPSIMSSPMSQKSLQIKQLESSRRTKDINKLIINRISTRDLEIPKQQTKANYSIFNSCRQLDSPVITQSQSQRQIHGSHKPAMSFSTINTSKWKSYRLTNEFQ